MNMARILIVMVVVLGLSLAMAAPALACDPNSTLTMSSSATEVSSGGTVVLTITEENTGDVRLEDPYVKVFANGILQTTLVAPPDSGETELEDGHLNTTETWLWTWESDPITETTTFRVEGWATYWDWPQYWEFGPSDDPDAGVNSELDEEEEITVTVTENGDGQGLTPGFWKNHLCAWPASGYSLGDDFDTVFGVDLFDPDITLEQAVNLGGGKCNALARHAVAALLNAAHPDVDYEYTVAEVIAMVQSGDCEGAKDDLEEQNEMGGVDAADVQGAKDC